MPLKISTRKSTLRNLRTPKPRYTALITSALTRREGPLRTEGKLARNGNFLQIQHPLQWEPSRGKTAVCRVSRGGCRGTGGGGGTVAANYRLGVLRALWLSPGCGIPVVAYSVSWHLSCCLRALSSRCVVFSSSSIDHHQPGTSALRDKAE